jgi:undecaprenyl-diphosphatase
VKSKEKVAKATDLSAARTLGGSGFFINLSELASPITTAGLTLVIGLGLYLRRRFSAIAGLAVAVGGANAAWILIKQLIERPRPPMRFASFLEPGSSFPSGHTTNAFALAVFCSLLATTHVPKGVPRTLLIGALMVLATLIAFARAYLGVHYLSDCLAGAALGAAFGLLGEYVHRSVRDYSTKRKNTSAIAMR